MRKMLEYLAVLQQVDSKLQELESLRGDLPLQVSRLTNEIEMAEQSLSENTELQKSHLKERDMTEMEIKTLEEQKKKYQSQLYEVKTNREYDAVTQEIETVKNEISMKESRILELMDLEVTDKETISNKKETIELLHKQLKEKKIELEKAMDKTKKDEADLHNEKNAILPKLDKKYLSAYNRIRKAKNGLAVVPIIRNACGGCSRSLPPQRILEIREMTRFYLCEVCGRILVWDEEAADSKP